MDVTSPKGVYMTGRSGFAASHTFWNCMGKNRWNLLFTEEGSCTVRNEYGEWSMNKGEMVLCAPSRERSFRTAGKWYSYWFHFDEPGAILHWNEVVRGIFLCRADASLAPRILSTVEEVHELILSPEKDLLLVENLLANLLLRGNAHPGNSSSHIMQECAAYLTKVPTLPSMGVLAQKFGMSRAKFYVEFKKHFGIPPHIYFEKTRLRKVKNLLAATDLSFTEIAGICGYGSLYYLSKRFSTLCGMTLRQYRRMNHALLSAKEEEEEN